MAKHKHEWCACTLDEHVSIHCDGCNTAWPSAELARRLAKGESS